MMISVEMQNIVLFKESEKVIITGRIVQKMRLDDDLKNEKVNISWDVKQKQ